MIVLKKLLKKIDLIGAYEGYLSSYALSNLILAFLVSKGVIPNLFTDLDDYENVSFISRKGKNFKLKTTKVIHMQPQNDFKSEN